MKGSNKLSPVIVQTYINIFKLMPKTDNAVGFIDELADIIKDSKLQKKDVESLIKEFKEEGVDISHLRDLLYEYVDDGKWSLFSESSYMVKEKQ